MRKTLSLLFVLILILMVSGIGLSDEKKDKAESLFESLKKRSQDEYIPAICFIFIHLIRGEKDEALKWLERSCEDHDSLLYFLRAWPQDFLCIPDDPEFQAVLKKYGLA